MTAQENWLVPVDIGQHIDYNDISEEKMLNFEDNFEIDIDSCYRLLPVKLNEFERLLDTWIVENKDNYLLRFNTDQLFKLSESFNIDLIVKELSEIVDWEKGNDAQYFSWISVDDKNQAEELNKLIPAQMLRLKSIRIDFPSDLDHPEGPYTITG